MAHKQVRGAVLARFMDGSYITRDTPGSAMARILRENSGLKCPEGCDGCSARWYGLVSHLMQRHGYSQLKAERAATKEMYGHA
jgi:hypothetical protein